MGGEGDLESATESGTGDRGDNRDTEGLEPAQLALDLTEAFGELGRLLLGHGEQVVQVATGEEGLLAGGDDDALDVVLLCFEALDGRRHGLGVGPVHGVGALVGVVDGQDDDAVIATLVLDGRAFTHWLVP